MSLISELRRRNVLRMAALYLITAWLIMQVVGVLMDLAALPDWIGVTTLILLSIGFPITLILAWFYELTPDGVALDSELDRSAPSESLSGRRLDVIIISLLAAAVILFAFDKWWKAAPEETSIAVMAFENLSGNSDEEYFSDSISVELLSLLARNSELLVIARSSSFAFKDQPMDVATVAKRLNVAYLVEGSVRRIGDRVRITAELVDGTSGVLLWSQSYERDYQQIFAVQESIAEAIADAVNVKVTRSATDTARPAFTAYDAYLRGRELIRLRDEESLRDAIRLLERAVRLESEFAAAHAQLGIAYGLLRTPGSTTEDRILAASPHLDRALEIDPNLAEAHAGRAQLLLPIDPAAAIAHARRALAINPSLADALYWQHLALYGIGDYREANAVLQRYLRVEPMSIVGRYAQAIWLARIGEFEEAHAVARVFIEEGLSWGHALHADIAINYQGDLVEGLRWALANGDIVGNGFHVFMLVGEYAEARRANSRANRWIDAAERNFDAGLDASERRLQRNPNDRRAIWERAEFLYEAGRLEEALPLYERLTEFVPENRPILTSLSTHTSSAETTMRLAYARRIVGDEEGAAAAAKIVKQDLAAYAAVGASDQFSLRSEAMLAAFEHDSERSLNALDAAIESGLRDPSVLADHVYDFMHDDPRFIDIQQTLETVRSNDRARVLQLICHDNPAPDDWQPMAETCEGVLDPVGL